VRVSDIIGPSPGSTLIVFVLYKTVKALSDDGPAMSDTRRSLMFLKNTIVK